jgi:hypothetical protein
MGNERQIEMLRAKVVASMPLRKSQQSTTSVVVEEREEGELSAEDEESLVPAMVSSSPPPLLRVFFFCFPRFFYPLHLFHYCRNPDQFSFLRLYFFSTGALSLLKFVVYV